MANLADDDLLLVQRTSAGISTNYSITGSALKEDLGGPDGLITPPVAVLTPLNGAGLNDGQSYTPMSSAYVSTDSTPIYHRYFRELITTVSGGIWTDENEMFDGNNQHYATLNGAADVVSQAVFTNLPSLSATGETQTWAYASGGGTIEVIDENDVVLRTYAMATAPQYPDRTDIGIVRVNNKIRYTTTNTNDNLYIAKITLGVGAGETVVSPVDYVINGRVAFEFTDDTDLDKMVAPIIQTDENGNVKIPTTSTVDSTTTIPGEDKGWTYSFVGNGSTKTINQNSDGIAPSGDRMLWAKVNDSRPSVIASSNLNGRYLTTSTSSAQSGGSTAIQLNEGATVLANANDFNANGKTSYMAEIGVAPKVLDTIRFTGNGQSIREIPHNLGCKPGMIIIKIINTSSDWQVWHKELNFGYVLELNRDDAPLNNLRFPSEPTAESFYVDSHVTVNGNGSEYVAYVFAADTPDKVKCGKYTGAGQGQSIPVGFRPGFILVKNMEQPGDWCATTKQLSQIYRHWRPSRSNTLDGGSVGTTFYPNNNGFYLQSADPNYNNNNEDYIYLAVHEDLTGPNSTQLNLLSGQDLEYFTTGTQITSNASASGSNISFASGTWAGTSNERQVFPSIGGTAFFDIRESAGNKWLLWIKATDKGENHYFVDSERHKSKWLMSNNDLFELSETNALLGPNPGSGNSVGYRLGGNGLVNQVNYNYIGWNFLAAPQFFDVQKYIGDGGYQTIQHDLGVEPGFIMIKSLSSSSNWICYHSALGGSNYLELNTDSAAPGGSNRVRSVTDADFDLGPLSTVNATGNDYIAYIFAKDTPYVKCGQYTSGSNGGISVNVGFRPRWMMIKRTNSSGDWILLDKNLPNQALYPSLNRGVDTGVAWSFNSTGVDITSANVEMSANGGAYVYVAIADESEGHPPSPPSSSTVLEDPDVNGAVLKVNAESFDVGATASAAPLEASITSVGGSEGNKLFVDASTGTWMPGLYAKGSETTINAPGPDEITFTSTNAGTTPFSGVDATLSSRKWTLESSSSATGPWTLVDTYVDYDVLNSQDGATPWSSNKPNLTPNTFYRVKVEYNSTNAESVESVYNTFKTGDA